MDLRDGNEGSNYARFATWLNPRVKVKNFE